MHRMLNFYSHDVLPGVAQPGFRFYSEGVYVEPKCGWKPEDLDHSVTLVGYGRTDSGMEYWHIRWAKTEGRHARWSGSLCANPDAGCANENPRLISTLAAC